MLGRIRSYALLACSFIAGACGQSGVHESSAPKALQPNLRFVGNTVVLATVPGAPLLKFGEKAVVPCNTGGIRIRYKYGNGGPVPAVAHQNKSVALGSPAFTFAFGPLGPGATRDAVNSI